MEWKALQSEQKLGRSGMTIDLIFCNVSVHSPIALGQELRNRLQVPDVKKTNKVALDSY
jgi:hypothetical protein